MPPSFPPACNSSPQAFVKPGLEKWGKHTVLPQVVFLRFKFEVCGGKLQFWEFCGVHCFSSKPNTWSSHPPTQLPLTHPSSPLQVKSGRSRLSIQANMPLIPNPRGDGGVGNMVLSLVPWFCRHGKVLFITSHLLDSGSSCPAWNH